MKSGQEISNHMICENMLIPASIAGEKLWTQLGTPLECYDFCEAGS